MPFVIWITGLPGSGKSTIADKLSENLPGSIVLRMDDLRKAATPNPSYSDQEREILYRAIVYFAKVLYQSGHEVIIDATANLRRWRDLARESITDYFEVYLRCSLEECRRREMSRTERHQAPKDIYKKAEEGWPVPGINVPYEEPLAPDVLIDTDKTEITEAVKIIIDSLRRKF